MNSNDQATVSVACHLFGGGKTSLIQYLLLSNISSIGCVILFSNTGVDAYEKNYQWLNPRYIYDSWEDGFTENKLIKLAKRIFKDNPNKHTILIFDDSVGMAKGLFQKESSKHIITTLRHYNVSIIVSTHQIQTEVSTLLRNNASYVFMFRQTEPNGVTVLFETFGAASSNLNNERDFKDAVLHLQPYTFFHSCFCLTNTSYNGKSHFLFLHSVSTSTPHTKR